MRNALILLLCLLAVPAASADRQAELVALQQHSREATEQAAQLAAQGRDLQNNLHGLQTQQADLTAQVQDSELQILTLQKQKTRMQSESDAQQAQLDKQRDALARLVLALQRLSRMPPQALLARPSAPIDTARSYSLLRHVLPAVSAQAADIKIMLQQLTALKAELAGREQELTAQRAVLTRQQDALTHTIKARQALLTKNSAAQRAAAAQAAKLGAQAKDLQDLLDRLAQAEQVTPKPALAQRIKNFFRADTSKLPVVGDIISGFGDRLNGGGQAQGLNIAAAPGAVVTAPRDGTVRFAGPFRQYKLLVIIQHGADEHALLGGLQQAYVRAGEAVARGQAVGTLPGAGNSAKMQGDSDARPGLYYERRRNGKPVDPLASG